MNRHVYIDGWAGTVVGKNDQSEATTRKVKRQTEGWPDSCSTGLTKLSYGLPRLPSVVARDKDQDARAQRQCYRGYFGCLQRPLRIANVIVVPTSEPVAQRELAVSLKRSLRLCG